MKDENGLLSLILKWYKCLKRFDPAKFEFAAQLELPKNGSYVVEFCIMKLMQLTTILQKIIIN